MSAEKKESSYLTSSQLHIIGMALMFADHCWHTLFPSYIWLTAAGRAAFPIFAFMAAEGYVHSSDVRKYIRRMLLFALISEIPFDFMVGGSVFYPFHQNVMWTFFIALSALYYSEKISGPSQNEGPDLGTRLIRGAVLTVGVLAGFAFLTDYNGAGVLLVYLFYFFRGDGLVNRAAQFLGMYYINVEMLGGYMINVELFGFEMELILQAFAMFALIPIWLYNGEKGSRSKAFQYFCYGFYPAHMLLLYLAARFVF